MNQLYKKFKNLTGFNYRNMADKVGVTRQYIQNSILHCSMVYKTSMAAIMNSCIDDKIGELEKHILNLNQLKKEIITESFKNTKNVGGNK